MQASTPEIRLNAKFWKTKRIQAGLTQKDASDGLGLSSPQYISNIERGLCEPSLQTVAILTKLYGLNKTEIVESMLLAYETEIHRVFTKKGKLRA